MQDIDHGKSLKDFEEARKRYRGEIKTLILNNPEAVRCDT